jgi:methylthioribose-1-phosphate isomerase
MTPEHIRYESGELRLLDQTQLPDEEVFLCARRWSEVAEAIRALRVRGAPAIGIAAAYALALEARAAALENLNDAALLERLQQAGGGLIACRPTAVNLSWAVKRMLSVLSSRMADGLPHEAIANALEEQARSIHQEDIDACRRIGAAGAGLFVSAVNVLTHCNTGDLATGGYGTALGIIRSLWADGKLNNVFVDETRPVLQGARLTVWELQRDRIPYTLITDSMAAHFMRRKVIDAIIVGADRIASNGDVANKIGTYGLAVLAREHGLPFVVAAPQSTFDLALASGDDIVIEQRKPEEVTGFAGVRAAPADARAVNPAFDITPADYITSIVTDAGVLRPPFHQSIAELIGTASRQVATPSKVL